MKILIAGLMLFAGGMAYAEEKNCVVKGMHCEGCKEMVEGKVCDESKYSTCEVKIENADKELGAVKLITKDQKAKVDVKGLAKAIEDAGYKLDKCQSPKHDKTAKKS